MALTASKTHGHQRPMASFSGALGLAVMSIPGRSDPAGLVETAFDELAQALACQSSTMLKNVASMSAMRSIRARTCMTGSPTRCSWSGQCNGHARAKHAVRPERTTCFNALDYLDNIDIYKDRIRHVPCQGCRVQSNRTPRVSIRGYQPWVDRAGRFRSLGDGQVDFGAGVFQNGRHSTISMAGPWSSGSAAMKHPEDGAREGALSSCKGSHHPGDGTSL